MSLFKRKDSPHWWVKFTHNGRRLQQSTGTADERKAREYHDKLKASLWDQDRLGIKPSHSWNEAVVRYLAETTHKASQSGGTARADRQARNACVQLPREAAAPGEHEGLALGAGESGHREFPMARSAAYLGELACAGRNAVACAAGAGRLGVRGDGAEVRTPFYRALSRLRGPFVELEIGCTGRRGYIPATRPEMKRACIMQALGLTGAPGRI